MILKEIIFALITGMIMGAVFSLIKLPVPAPSSFAGVVGIFGIFLGYSLIRFVLK
jgi:XapX domain-containing protein